MDLIDFDPLSTADPKTDSAGIFGGKIAKVIADRSYTAGTVPSHSLTCSLAHYLSHPSTYSPTHSLTSSSLTTSFSLSSSLTSSLTSSFSLSLFLSHFPCFSHSFIHSFPGDTVSISYGLKSSAECLEDHSIIPDIV